MDGTDRTGLTPRATRPPSRSASPTGALTTAALTSMRPTPGPSPTGRPTANDSTRQLTTATVEGRCRQDVVAAERSWDRTLASEILEDVLDPILGVAEEHRAVRLQAEQRD